MEKINKFVNVENMRKLFKQEFVANSNRFTFSFCGDLPEDEIFEDLISLYLGGLPRAMGSRNDQIPKQLQIINPKTIEKHVSKTRVLTDKSDVLMIFQLPLTDQKKV